MTYAELKQAIQDYLQSTETKFVANLDNFIRAAERKIYTACDTPDSGSTIVSSTIAISTQTIDTPGDFIRPVMLLVDSEPLLLKDLSFIKEAFPGGGAAGVPLYYAIQSVKDQAGTPVTIIVGPKSDKEYGYELHYIRNRSIITDGFSWVGDHAQDALLNACIVEGYKFLKGEPELTKKYEDDANASIQALVQMLGGKAKSDSQHSADARS